MVRRVVVGLLVGLLCGVGGVAWGVEGDGLWYVSDYGVEGLWGQGVDGSGVTIAVIDTPIDPSVPWLVGADIEVFDNPFCGSREDLSVPLAGVTSLAGDAFHGTAVVSLLVGNGQDGKGGQGPVGLVPKAKVLLYPEHLTDDASGELWGSFPFCAPRRGVSAAEAAELGVSQEFLESGSEEMRMAGTAYQIQRAIDAGADVINFSFGLVNVKPGSPVEEALLRAVKEKVVLVAGTSNDATARLSEVSSDPGSLNYFPGVLSLNGVTPDQAVTANTAMRDPGVDILAPSDPIFNVSPPHRFGEPLATLEADPGGNSSATPIMAGYIGLLMSKYPQATGNQILGVVLDSTLDHEVVGGRDPQDVRGWGSFRPSGLDPMTYPDVNPVFAYDIQRLEEFRANYVIDYANDKINPMGDWRGGCYADGRDLDFEEMTPENCWPNVMALHEELTSGGSSPEASASPEPSSGPQKPAGAQESSGLPSWVWIIVGFFAVAIIAVVVLIIVLVNRKPHHNPPTGYRY